MSNSSVKVKMDHAKLGKLTSAQIKACRAVAAKMLAEKIDQQQIPFKEGTLQNIATDVDDSAAKNGTISIVSRTPYAERLYMHPEYNFNHAFNSNAQGEWWEDYITGDRKNRPEKLYKYFYKKFTEGVVD